MSTVFIEQLPPGKKNQLWNGINRSKPDYAEGLQQFMQNEMVQQLRDQHGFEVVIDQKKYDYFMNQGAGNAESK